MTQEEKEPSKSKFDFNKPSFNDGFDGLPEPTKEEYEQYEKVTKEEIRLGLAAIERGEWQEEKEPKGLTKELYGLDPRESVYRNTFSPQEPESKWIKVADRLPEVYNLYLVVINRSGREIIETATYFTTLERFGGVFGDFVTHWQELPLLPKE